MPRHRRQQVPATPPLEGMWALCRKTHTGPGGYVARGDQVRLEHANVRRYPGRFELAGPIPDWIIERIQGPQP